MRPLRIALTKGRLEKSTVALFEKAGIDCTQVHEKGRRLILPVGDGSIEMVLSKAADVITYVENGVCDMGVVGKDTIMENGTRFFEVMDLDFGRCRFALAGPKGMDFYAGYREKIVASKYPNVTRAFFEEKMMDVRVIKIEGSVELAPLLGKIRSQNRQISLQMAQLSRRQEEFSAITDTMEEGFLVLDTRTHVLSHNAAALRLLDAEDITVEQETSAYDLNREAGFRRCV